MWLSNVKPLEVKVVAATKWHPCQSPASCVKLSVNKLQCMMAMYGDW